MFRCLSVFELLADNALDLIRQLQGPVQLDFRLMRVLFRALFHANHVGAGWTDDAEVCLALIPFSLGESAFEKLVLSAVFVCSVMS